MAVRLFVLGCPGCGKSTVARYIVEYVKQRYSDWSAIRISDYSILYKMFRNDTDGKYFRGADYGGFIVHENSVYDEALKKVEEEANSISTTDKGLILIEFARSNYREALMQFNHDFVSNAYFLFLDTDVDICIKRVKGRIIYKAPIDALDEDDLDDHFVPEAIIEAYRNINNKRYLSSHLKADHGIADREIAIIDNAGQFEDIADKVHQFIESILQSRGADSGTSNV